MSGIGQSTSGQGRSGKRVWTHARAVAEGEGFAIMLDARPLRLPGGVLLTLRSRRLAEAVAQEWSDAGGGVVGGLFGAGSLPLTRLAGTLQERVAPNRPHAVATLLGYVDSDLLCYRATHPAALVERQQAEWQPWLDWHATHHGIRLFVTEGVMPASQPEAAVLATTRLLETQDNATLTALGVLVPALGSLVLGFAVVADALSPPDAARLALLDELDQLARWGPDGETEARHTLLGEEIRDAARFAALARQDAHDDER
jgi:chaperone required for assembly of F1-ATPase